MQGDFSRESFQPEKQYSGVMMQQGRVILDSDWNDNERIHGEEARRQRVDVIGAAGARIDGDGFLVSNVRTVNGGMDFDIQSGVFYLGGLKLELEEPISYLRQPNWLQGSDAKGVGGVGQTDLVYLEAWQQLVTATEDSELAETALGGPDTSVRTRNMFRVKVLQNVGETERDAAWANATDHFESIGEGVLGPGNELSTTAKMEVDFTGSAVTVDEYDPPIVGRYLGAENQTIRVQIVEGNRFTWGFDNASSLYRARFVSNGETVGDTDGETDGEAGGDAGGDAAGDAGGDTDGDTVGDTDTDADAVGDADADAGSETGGGAGGDTLKFLTLPEDPAHEPLAGDIVEILPWSALLTNGEKIAALSGRLSRVSSSYDSGDQIVIEDRAAGDQAWQGNGDSEDDFVYVRVWNRGSDRLSAPEIDIPCDGSLVNLGTTGLAVRFSGGPFRAGDYWTIAARPNTPSKVVPWALDAPTMTPGIRKFAAPLSLIKWPISPVRAVFDEPFDQRSIDPSNFRVAPNRVAGSTGNLQTIQVGINEGTGYVLVTSQPADPSINAVFGGAGIDKVMARGSDGIDLTAERDPETADWSGDLTKIQAGMFYQVTSSAESTLEYQTIGGPVAPILDVGWNMIVPDHYTSSWTGEAYEVESSDWDRASSLVAEIAYDLFVEDTGETEALVHQLFGFDAESIDFPAEEPSVVQLTFPEYAFVSPLSVIQVGDILNAGGDVIDASHYEVPEIDCRPKFPALTELIQLSYVGGDGQEVGPGYEEWLHQRLEVAVSNGQWPVEGATVEFEIETRAGELCAETMIVNGVLSADGNSGTKLQVETDSEGIASVQWQLDGDPKKPNQRVTAQLLDPGGTRHHIPVVFNASLSLASEVTYDAVDWSWPDPSPDSVRDALDDLYANTTLSYVGGNGQEVAPDMNTTPPNPSDFELPLPLLVRVANGRRPVDEAMVEFSIEPINGDGVLSADSGSDKRVLAKTNADGLASCVWQLDAENPSQRVVARMKNPDGCIGLPVFFNANLSLASEVSYDPEKTWLWPDPVPDSVRDALDDLYANTTLSYVGGSGQEVAPIIDPTTPIPGGLDLPHPLEVRVANGGWPLENAVVRFSIENNSGLLSDDDNSGSPLEVSTNDDGLASVRWRLDPTPQSPVQRVKAQMLASNIPVGSPVFFEANLSLASEVTYDPVDWSWPNPAPETIRDALDDLYANTALYYAGGDGQEATPENLVLPQSLQVRVANGRWPVHGIGVEFSIMTGSVDDGVLTANKDTGRTVIANTIGVGIASCEWQLDDKNPSQRVKAQMKIDGDDVGSPIFFNASLSLASEVSYLPVDWPWPDPAPDSVRDALDDLYANTTLSYVGGNGQEVAPDMTQTPIDPGELELPFPLLVRVANGRWPVDGATVEFSIDTGAGLLSRDASSGLSVEVQTDGEGHASVDWRLDPDLTSPNQRVMAWMKVGMEHIGSPIFFNASLSLASEVTYVGKNWKSGDPHPGSVKDGLDSLYANSGLYFVGGDGQEATLTHLDLPQQLQVRVANGRWPVKGVEIEFSIEKPVTTGGELKSDSSFSPHIGRKVRADTNDQGLASCDWQLDDETPSQRVKAQIKIGTEYVKLPIFFNASLSVATVQYPAFHVEKTTMIDPRWGEINLVHGGSLSFETLSRGISIECDMNPAPQSVDGKPACFVELKMPHFHTRETRSLVKRVGGEDLPDLAFSWEFDAGASKVTYKLGRDVTAYHVKEVLDDLGADGADFYVRSEIPIDSEADTIEVFLQGLDSSHFDANFRAVNDVEIFKAGTEQIGARSLTVDGSIAADGRSITWIPTTAAADWLRNHLLAELKWKGVEEKVLARLVVKGNYIWADGVKDPRLFLAGPALGSSDDAPQHIQPGDYEIPFYVGNVVHIANRSHREIHKIHCPFVRLIKEENIIAIVGESPKHYKDRSENYDGCYYCLEGLHYK